MKPRPTRGCRAMEKKMCGIIGGIMLAGFSWLSEAVWDYRWDYVGRIQLAIRSRLF